jgi:hypothetical protein
VAVLKHIACVDGRHEHCGYIADIRVRVGMCSPMRTTADSFRLLRPRARPR